MNRTTRTLVAVAALTLLPAAAAWAHPALDGEAKPGAATELTLVIPHGCSPEGGMPTEGNALPTIEIDIQLVEGVGIEPLPVDGWASGSDGDVVTFSDDGGATTDVIQLPVLVTVDAEPGAVLDLPVYQLCTDDVAIRWTAGSEEFPALRVVAAGGEPMAADDGHAHASDEPDMGADDGHMMGDEHVDLGSGETDGGAQALADEQADGAAGAIALGALALVVLLLIGGLVARGRGEA